MTVDQGLARLMEAEKIIDTDTERCSDLHSKTSEAQRKYAAATVPAEGADGPWLLAADAV